MTEAELLKRTKKFALRIMKLADAIPNKPSGRVISSQLLRSGTSVGANYRAACRGRSKLEFISKLGTCEEEADESAFWMELLAEGGLMKPQLVGPLHREASELTAIMASSRRTAKETPTNGKRHPTIANRKSQIANQP
jgi:four helix bundle protein